MKLKNIFVLLLILLLPLTSCSKNEARETLGKVEKITYYSNPKVTTGDEALNLLKEGNKRYVEETLKNYDLGKEKREALSKGQSPHTVIVTCSDSRVAPEHLFDQGLGDIFIIRVAGNVLDKDEIGSVEYAVDHLKTPLVVMMGHESCGAVTSAVDMYENPNSSHGTENINAILNKIIPSVKEAKKSNLKGEELVNKSIDLNIDSTVKQIKEQSPIIKQGIANGKVKVVGAKYILSTGEVKWNE